MLELILEKLDIKKVLLLDPDFPRATKSRNHKDLLPIGLLKIGSYLKNENIETKLIRLTSNEIFDDEILKFNPDLVLVTSVFTYWAKEVKQAVEFSKKLLPNVPVMVGGIFASLLPDVCKEYTHCDYIHQGIVKCVECLPPDYSLLENNGEDIDFQIIHSSRGCNRRCKYCGVYNIEPEFLCKTSIKDEIIRKNLVFYDNNLLINQDIEILLNELIDLKKNRIITKCESQSGFDGRILRKKPHLAKLIKEANFKDPKIAWDGPFKTAKNRKKEIDILVDAGYNPKDISIFMIYNAELSYLEMEEKRAKCFEWGVQITDCRYRPLTRLDDNYNSHARKPQSNKEYHINPNWSDEEIRQFRRNVRRHNICIRHDMKYHSYKAERKKISKEESMKYRYMDFEDAKKFLTDAWNPAEPHLINVKSKQTTL